MSNDVVNDLMVNIFERLPLKSIIRLRSVSKYWRSRIASREFINNYRLRCSPKVLIRHLNYCGQYRLKDIYTLHAGDQLPLHPGPRYMGIPGVEFPQYDEAVVVGSYNGLLCLRSDKEISLWNVSIRRRLILPHHRCLKSPKVAFGFGYDSIYDDYKVVAISNYDKIPHKTFIYSLKKESWSVIPSLSTRFLQVNSKTCLVNGILHWLADGYLTQNPGRFILTFDLSSHVFGYILFPQPWTIRQLTTIDGCLAAVSWNGGSWEYGFIWRDGVSWLWVMKEYGETESWSVRCRVKTGQPFKVTAVFQPLTNGDILTCYGASKVHSFQTGLSAELMEFGPCRSNVEMEPYVESLELVDKESATACGEAVFSSTIKEYNHFATSCSRKRW